MAVTLSEKEGAVDKYPTVPRLSVQTQALDMSSIWQRIESYVAHRWCEREVVYVVEGPGTWEPRLTPFAMTLAECWGTSNTYETVSLKPSPFGGFILESDGPYRFTGTAGANAAPPAPVIEAFHRLAEYNGGSAPAVAGASMVNDGRVSYERNPAYSARAIQLSGAADLLRPYRRLGA